MTAEEYITSRVDEQIEWYSNKSSWNQRIYKLAQTIEIILASSIPLFAGFASQMNWAAILIGAFGVIIAVIESLTKLYKLHENWIQYRSTSELLKYQKFLYVTQSAPYATQDESVFNLFVRNIEQIVSSENNQWKVTQAQVESIKTDTVKEK